MATGDLHVRNRKDQPLIVEGGGTEGRALVIGSDGLAEQATFAAGQAQWHGIEAAGALTFSNSTHVVTMASGTNTYWFQGTRYTTASAITCDLDSYVTLTANTLYFVGFDAAAGVLKATATPWDLTTIVPVATVFWNGSAGALADERHGHTRNLAWHKWAHLTVNTRYGSGLTQTLPTTTTDGSLQIESGTIYDEDIAFTIAQQTTMRGWYQVSAGVYTFADYALPYLGTAGAPVFLDTDTYTLATFANGDYACYWVYATTDLSRPIYIVPSQRAAAHGTVALARAETAPSLSGLNLAPEMKLIYRWIYSGNGQYQEGEDYRLTSPLPSGGIASTTAGAVSFSPSGTIAGTTVQTAIEELDTEKAAVAQTMRHVANIAALKALNVAGIADETPYYVAGYYAQGDGGEGVFRYDAGSSATDNAGTIIQPTAGSGRWLRDGVAAEVTTMQFGITASTDADKSTALQAFIEYCEANYKRGILLSGPYRIDSALTFGVNGHIVGVHNSFGCTTLRPNSNRAITIDGAVRGSGGDAFHNTIQDIIIWPLANGTPPAELIFIGQSYNNKLINIRTSVSTFNTKLADAAVRHTLGHNNTFINCVLAIDAAKASPTADFYMSSGEAHIVGGDIETARYGIFFEGGMLTIDHLYSEQCTFHVYLTNGSASADSALTSHGHIIRGLGGDHGYYLDSCKNVAVSGLICESTSKIRGDGSPTVSNVRFSNVPWSYINTDNTRKYVTLDGFYISNGSPESVIAAPTGSLAINIVGGAGTTLYVKQSGTGNTGWVGK